MAPEPTRDDEVLHAIEDLARKHLGWEGVLTPASSLADAMALDSLRRLTLVVEIENRFRICLDDEDEVAIETVGDLVNAIERRASGRIER